jgi:hypothetical protein
MKKVLLSIALFLVCVVYTSAEVQNVKVSGELRNRGVYSENLLDANDDATTDEIGFFAQRARINVEADLTDNVLVAVELEAEGIVGDKEVVRNADATTDITGSLSLDSTATSQGRKQKDGYHVDVTQAFIQASELYYTPLTAKVGRQYLNFGKGFLISDNEHEINFDAIRTTWDFYPIIVDALYARLAERSSQSLTAVDADDTSMYVVNGHYAADRWNAEAYLMGLVDGQNHYQPATVGIRGDIMPLEALSVWGELAYQLNQYSSVQDLSAYAGTIGASYTFEFAWHPSLSVAYTIASGDEDPTNLSDDYDGFQELFEYNYYGYAYSPRLENIHFINAKVSVLPMENLTLALDYYHYMQLEENVQSMGDSFQDNGGFALATNGTSDDLGDELDIVAEYDYTEDVSTQLYLAWYVPGSAYTPDDTAFEIRGEILVSF